MMPDGYTGIGAHDHGGTGVGVMAVMVWNAPWRPYYAYGRVDGTPESDQLKEIWEAVNLTMDPDEHARLWQDLHLFWMRQLWFGPEATCERCAHASSSPLWTGRRTGRPVKQRRPSRKERTQSSIVLLASPSYVDDRWIMVSITDDTRVVYMTYHDAMTLMSSDYTHCARGGVCDR